MNRNSRTDSPTVAALGTFDGMHRAHRKIIDTAMKLAGEMDRDRIIVVTISGRGDKDCAAIARYRGEDISE